MSERGKRGKGVRSYLALHKLEALGLDPIEEMLKVVGEMDAIADTNIKAFESGRGWSEKGDAGPSYLANALRAKAEKLAVYTKLSSYLYPTLSAVGIKDINKEEDRITSRVVSALEVRQTILNDPFAMIDGPTQVPLLTSGHTPEETEIKDVSQSVQRQDSEQSSFRVRDGGTSETTGTGGNSDPPNS